MALDRGVSENEIRAASYLLVQSLRNRGVTFQDSVNKPQPVQQPIFQWWFSSGSITGTTTTTFR